MPSLFPSFLSRYDRKLSLVHLIPIMKLYKKTAGSTEGDFIWTPDHHDHISILCNTFSLVSAILPTHQPLQPQSLPALSWSP